jgi:hypothetical protein
MKTAAPSRRLGLLNLTLFCLLFCARHAATPLGVISIYQDAVLERVRFAINQLIEQSQSSTQASPTGGSNGNGDEKNDWCFIDCKFIHFLFGWSVS